MGYRTRPVLMIHKRDGHVIQRFESTDAAAVALGVCPSDVSRSARNRTLARGSYIMRFENEWEGREDFAGRARNKPVIIFLAGRLLWFPNIKRAAAALRVDYNTLAGAIRARRPTLGAHARYATSTGDWPNLMKVAAMIAKKETNDSKDKGEDAPCAQQSPHS